MKKYILFTIIAFLAFSCETKTIEVETGGGEIVMGQYAGEKLFFASDETIEIAKTMVNAYSNKDLILLINILLTRYILNLHREENIFQYQYLQMIFLQC